MRELLPQAVGELWRRREHAVCSRARCTSTQLPGAAVVKRHHGAGASGRACRRTEPGRARGAVATAETRSRPKPPMAKGRRRRTC
eukprot:SM009250S24658  [mRNA]  locus=s9250:102:527:+ [translate_table: standard]